ncbi:unnamed protein product [Prunus armeniaca]
MARKAISIRVIGRTVRGIPELGLRYRSMSDSESFSKREPNAFDGESSDGLFNSDNEAVSPAAEGGSDTDVEILSEGPSFVPSHGIGKGLMTAPVPLSIIYSDGPHVGLGMPAEMSAGRRSKTSTSGRGESAAEPSSQPRVLVVYPSNPRVPTGVPKENLFGVDYLGPNKIIEREIAKYRVSTNENPGPYRIPQQAEGRRGGLLYRRPYSRCSVAIAASGTEDFGPDRLCSGTI